MDKTFIDNMVFYREQKGWTQKELAKEAGLSASCISMLECGKREPNVITLKAIASALRISIDTLLNFGVYTTRIDPFDPYTHDEKHIITMYRRLNNGMKENVREMLVALAGDMSSSTKKSG